MKGSTSLLNCSQSVQKVALLCLTGEPWLRKPLHLPTWRMETGGSSVWETSEKDARLE